MAKFRDLSGSFFSIPEEELERYRVSPEQLPFLLKNEQVSGTEIGECGPQASPREGLPSRIIVNQFFTPMKDPNVPCDRGDFAAQYTYPAAWGGNR